MRIPTKFALAAGVALFALPTLALAADKPTDATDKDDIVVTGTLIRGTQATGSQTITVDAKAITDVAATSTNELLASLPQVGSFNSRPEGDPRGLTAVAAIVRPNIRNFPSSNLTSGALTLILVDGMRVTPVGSNASSVDPDVIPSAILEGVDIVTDGGSSLYGADAVAGVMNFRTMKKFEGVKIDGNYGFGDRIKGFHSWDGSITAGKSWSTGNAYVSVSHSDRDSVLNGETPWANGKTYNSAGTLRLTSTQCNVPQATGTGWYRYGAADSAFTNNPAAPGAGAIATGTGCDQILAGTYLPSLKRTNVYASLTNSFSDTVDLRVTGYWMRREMGLPGYPLGYTSRGSGITSAAQLTAAYPAALATAVGSVFVVPEGTGFALGPNTSYVNTPQKIGIETWGFSPELTVKLGGDWQVRTSVHLGHSNGWSHYPGLNTTALDGYITGGQIVPSNIAAASSAVIADITNWETAQETTHDMFVFRSVADGSLFTLPGGNAKLAVGAEFQNNKDATRINTGKNGVIDTLPYLNASRNVKSLFGELHLPVTTFADAAASVRYDSYSDGGHTTNPNFGLTLKPTSWLKVYGHWGTSFNAPTPYDDIGVALGRSGANYRPGAPASYGVPAAGRPTVALGKTDNGSGSYFIVLTGSAPNSIKPQTSKDWSLGFDAQPLTGLSLGAEFYHINLKNMIGTMNPANGSTYTTNPGNYYYNGELNTVDATTGKTLFQTIMNQLINGGAVTTAVGGSGANVAILVDTRTGNLNAAIVEGLDLHLNYQFDTSFGHITFANNANVSTKAKITTNGALTNELGHGGPRFTWSSSLGLNKGGASAKVTVNYSGKYHDNALDNLGVEEVARPFIVTNFNLGYDFAGSSSVLKGTSLRLTVDNLFNVKPQVLLRPNTNNPNYLNWTLGRVIKLGFTEKF